MPLANFCNRRSTRAPVPSPDCRARCSPCGEPRRPRRPRLGRRDPRCARPPCGDPAPTDPRLTAWCQLRSFPCTLTVPALPPSRRTSRRSAGPFRGGSSRRRTVFGCGAAARATSDVSCHARSANDRRCGRPFRVRREPSPPPPRQRRLLATTRDAFHRQVLPGPPPPREGHRRNHPRYWMGACHRAPRLATRCRLPGPVRQPLLSRRMARQRSCSARSSRVGERCRVPPVDFCNRNDPRARPRMSELRSTTPAVARWCSFSPGGRALSGTFRAADGRSRSRELASRGSTGQGLCGGRGDAGLTHRATSPTAIARGRSLAPTRSTRAPHVADRDDLRPETTASPETRCTRLPRSTSLADAGAPPCVPGPAAAGAPGEGRFTCRPAKVSALSRTRGAFHRRVPLPFSGSRPTLHSLSPVCGKGVASASSIPDSALQLVTRAQAIEDSVAPGDDRP
jgi:hypothetical protein